MDGWAMWTLQLHTFAMYSIAQRAMGKENEIDWVKLEWTSKRKKYNNNYYYLTSFVNSYVTNTSHTISKQQCSNTIAPTIRHLDLAIIYCCYYCHHHEVPVMLKLSPIPIIIINDYLSNNHYMYLCPILHYNSNKY